MRNYDQLRDAWELDSVEAISDFVDVGERVAVRWRWRGVGRGPDFNWEVTGVFTFRNGKIFYIEHFPRSCRCSEGRTLGIDGRGGAVVLRHGRGESRRPCTGFRA